MLKIYTWTEFWLIVSVPTAMTGVWFLFSFFLGISNVILRAVSIWLLIFILCLGAATVEAVKKQKG